MPVQLTHLSLFSGIGGLDLAAEWAGFTTVGQCEWADYPTKVLEKHWPDVPRWRDIRTLTKESFYEQTGLRTVDIISGGFPCQPHSTAGNRKASLDERDLSGEFLRVINAFSPTFVVAENVQGLLFSEGGEFFRRFLQGLVACGYRAGWVCVPATLVGAVYERDRVFIVAISANSINDYPLEKSKKFRAQTNTGRSHRQVLRAEGTADTCTGGKAIIPVDRAHIHIKPGMDRTAYGVPNRVDRLKCLGNAVVPQQAYPIFRAIAEIERSTP